jgi:legumain
MKMHESNKYAKMVFYIEACESGSMFKGLLPDNVNVFATTASNATTSSYACYFDKKRKTFLGDVYSIKWLEDSDKENIEKITLEHQYIVVKNETNTSMVCQFGDKSISQMEVGTFQGLKPVMTLPHPPPTPHYPPSWFSCGRDAVPGPMIPVKILQNNIAMAENAQEAKEAREKLAQLLKNRKYMETKVRTLVHSITNNDDETISMFTDNKELTEYDCYYAAVDEFHDLCFNVGRNDHALRMLNTLVNLCQKNYHQNLIIDAIQAECTHPPMYGIH